MEFEAASSIADELGLALTIHSWKPHVHTSEVHMEFRYFCRSTARGAKKLFLGLYLFQGKPSLRFKDSLLMIKSLSQPSPQYQDLVQDLNNDYSLVQGQLCLTSQLGIC